MRRQGILALAASFLALWVTTSNAATTWSVPGNNSNVCTVVNPNCNTIAQAVTAATSGDTINIGAGNFPAPAAIVLTKTLTIAGAGIGATFVQPTSAGFSVRTNDIVIRDLAMQNGTVGIAFQSASSNNTQITRVAFSGQTSRGIDMQLAATFLVSNVVITDCQFATTNIGLRTSSTTQVAGLTITGTSFTGNPYGIYVANDGNSSKFSGLTIQNSTFTNNTNYSIYAEEMRDCLIEDSTFTGGSTGIGLFKFYSSNATAMSNITIRRDQFSQHRGTALDIEMFAMALQTPIDISANTFATDVSVITSNASAIFTLLSSSFTTHAAINITNNTFTATGAFASATATHGIRMRGNGPLVITGNSFDGGNVGGSGTTPDSSALWIESNPGAMAATATFTASCNRIGGFENGVSVFNSTAGTYGGLPSSVAVTLTTNNIVGNSIVGVINGAAPPTVSAMNNWWGCLAGPGNAGCDTISGGVDASNFATTPSTCAPCVSNSQCEDFNPCSVDICSMTCSNSAGNSGTTCRAAVAVCDQLETCDGSSITCPADAFQASSVVCRPSAGVCDPGENCTGSAAACPPDAKSSVVCRAAAGVCDIAESCDGVGNACPVDAKSSAVCRPAAGVCDVSESCNGVGDACPVDAKSSAVCRPAADVCDVSESCNGVADNCPADAFRSSVQVCRAAAGSCDVAENCTGAGAACPADTFQPSTSVCRASAGTCDVAESCTGSSAPCPSDAFQASTVVCRAVASNCDVAESCTGSQAACPIDTLQPDGSICNAGNFCSAGVCQAPNSLVLSRASLYVNARANRANGRATARSLVNDNDTGGTLETQLLAGTVTLRIQDAGTFTVTRTFSNCTKSRTRIRCQSADRKTNAAFASRPGPYIYQMRVRFSGLGSLETGGTRPTGPVTVTMDQGGLATRDDVIGNIVPCWSHWPTRLTCRED